MSRFLEAQKLKPANIKIHSSKRMKTNVFCSSADVVKSGLPWKCFCLKKERKRHVQIWRFSTDLHDQRKFELNEQEDTEIMIECCAERRRRRWREDFLLISHTEHNLLLASPCLFFSPSACAHASPVSFWHAHLPTKALCLSSLAVSLSLLLPHWKEWHC